VSAHVGEMGGNKGVERGCTAFKNETNINFLTEAPMGRGGRKREYHVSAVNGKAFKLYLGEFEPKGKTARKGVFHGDGGKNSPLKTREIY